MRIVFPCNNLLMIQDLAIEVRGIDVRGITDLGSGLSYNRLLKTGHSMDMT